MRCSCSNRVRVIIARSSSVAMPSTRGNPVSGITPPSFASHAHPHFLLHRHLNELSDHRNVAVASFSDSLPWHPFHFFLPGEFIYLSGDCIFTVWTLNFVHLITHKLCIMCKNFIYVKCLEFCVE